MGQNGIKELLATHQIVPVVTIQSEDEIEGIVKKLRTKGNEILTKLRTL